MRSFAIKLSVLLLLLFSAALLCAQSPESAATESAARWLALTDAGNYAESWEQASPMFKKAVTKAKWTQAMQSSREPLGKLLSRNIKSATYSTSLPGAPDGKYVVIQYESSFERKDSATETVTPSLGSDGKWRVSGYYIR